MKKLILVVTLMLAMSQMAKAQEPPIELDLKVVKLVLPFQDVKAVYLYDLINSVSLGGMETPFLKSGKWQGVLGAADVEGSEEAIPYVGADVDVSEKYLGERFNLGAWVAHDFDTKENRGGIKASMLLW